MKREFYERAKELRERLNDMKNTEIKLEKRVKKIGKKMFASYKEVKNADESIKFYIEEEDEVRWRDGDDEYEHELSQAKLRFRFWTCHTGMLTLKYQAAQIELEHFQNECKFVSDQLDKLEEELENDWD